MSGYEFTPPPRKIPETKPASAGGPPQPPPKPPKLTARDLLESGEPEKRIFVPDYIEIRDLAGLLGVKPFTIVREVLELRMFKHADDLISFPTAVAIAERHGFVAETLM